MKKKYILKRETGKIELHFEKSEYQEMPEEQKRILKSNYLFSRKAEAWVSRAKYPNLYYAKRAAEELGFTEGEKIGERLTYAEQLQRQADRAEARAERYLVTRKMPSSVEQSFKRSLTSTEEILLSLRSRLFRDMQDRKALQDDATEYLNGSIRV